MVFQGARLTRSARLPARPLRETIFVTASTTGILDAWIDWNDDGVWESSEKLAFKDPNGADVTTLQPGVNQLVLLGADGLANSATFDTFVRFRFSTTGRCGRDARCGPPAKPRTAKSRTIRLRSFRS